MNTKVMVRTDSKYTTIRIDRDSITPSLRNALDIVTDKFKEPEITPKNVKDLVTIAKSRGIKNSTTMSKKKLCDILELEITRPDKLIFRNKETRDERKFKSIYRASKEMNVNPGLIHHHMNTSGVITAGGIIYDVCKITTTT